MEIQIDKAALGRRKATAMALKVLEASIEQVLGFPVQVQSLSLWASPVIFEEGRVPASFVRLTPTQELLDAQMQTLLQSPTPAHLIPSAKEMIAKQRAAKKAAKTRT